MLKYFYQSDSRRTMGKNKKQIFSLQDLTLLSLAVLLRFEAASTDILKQREREVQAWFNYWMVHQNTLRTGDDI